MTEKDIVRFTARLPEELYMKLKISAEINKRSVAKEIEFVLEKAVKEGFLDEVTDNQHASTK